jgi:hypothetical protein
MNTHDASGNMFSYLYKLKGKTPVICNTVAEWFRGSSENIICFNELILNNTYIQVKTKFTGIDYGEKKLFQTTIIKGDCIVKVLRCRTWAQAEQQHKQTINSLLNPGINFLKKELS